MTNPFESTDHSYHVLVNEEGQYSLWPAFAEVPGGWDVVLRDADRDAALDYVEAHWTDMRPLSLVRVMDGEN
ncbi:MbtH family protein [Actinomadura syzygii]|uniref:MbtH family protein n=1 Tax=Actinomadura syzygii TaxID=1427538 RepID=A0A5D0TPM9_9ACTN|nr:MbtH family protein [Actinomadura syzygii]TYC07623.1 MbtH family protein [Actinomadura syzygii]